MNIAQPFWIIIGRQKTYEIQLTEDEKKLLQQIASLSAIGVDTRSHLSGSTLYLFDS